MTKFNSAVAISKRLWRWVIPPTQHASIAPIVVRLRFLAKALLPMPDKYHGVTDKELRYRQCYVNLIASGSGREKLHGELTSREVFERRAQIIREIRRPLKFHKSSSWRLENMSINVHSGE